MKVTLRQLQYLEAVARLKHFTKAARYCHVSQAGLSSQLKKLEDDLNVSLFNREAKDFQLTPVGKQLTEQASEILKSVSTFQSMAELSRELWSRDINIGVIPSIAPYIISDFLREVGIHFPRCTINFKEKQTRELQDLLLQHQIDAAIVALPSRIFNANIHSVVNFHHLTDDEFILALPKNHLSEEKRYKSLLSENSSELKIKISKVRGDDLILLDEGHCLREQALGLFKDSSEAFLSRYSATNMNTIMEMVAGGLGKTLVPAMSVKNKFLHPAVAYVHFEAPAPKREVVLMMTKNNANQKDLLILKDLLFHLLN